MSNDTEKSATEAWIRKQLDSAVNELVEIGAIRDKVAEARPVWSLPQKLVLGQIREADDHTSAKWFVCGDTRTDFIGIEMAAVPRDALKYFSLKWQMDAGRYTDPDAAERLVRLAEELYDIVEEASFGASPPA
jgi:hypothetical protein